MRIKIYYKKEVSSFHPLLENHCTIHVKIFKIKTLKQFIEVLKIKCNFKNINDV
ncbi:MAG: hypothetical protein ACI9Q3_001020 [Maribacter sp.]|jgi:hypothetical protein